MSAQSAIGADYIRCGSVNAGDPHYDTIRETKLIFGTSTFRGSTIGMKDPTTTLVLFSGEVWFQTSEHANNSFRTLMHEVPLRDVMFSVWRSETINSDRYVTHIRTYFYSPVWL
jgi:hypothetical protein